MTIAFTAEVDTPTGTKYVGKQGALVPRPVFHATSTKLKEYLRLNRSYLSDTQFKRSRDELKTVVIVVRDLEKGMAASQAEKMSIRKFEETEYSTSSSAPKVHKNTVFKLEYSGSGLGTNRKKFAGASRFGKTWTRQGDLRLHLTANLHKFATNTKNASYRGATVVAIQLNDDGITPQNVKRIPVDQFYSLNPKCKIRLAEATRTSLSSVNENFNPSPYA
jgi:hypothetical protein